MSTWYYTNEKGEQVSVTGGQLKWLAKNGKITPETMVETEDGKKARAGKVKGLTFITPEAIPSESASPEPAQSAESEIYAVAAPPPKPSPFTASMPETVNMSVTDPSVITNPFSVPMPVVAKPADSPFMNSMPESANSFTTVPTVSTNPFAIAFETIVSAICGLFLFFQFANFFRYWYDSDSLGDALARNSIGLVVSALGCAAVIMVVHHVNGGYASSKHRRAHRQLFTKIPPISSIDDSVNCR